MPPPPSPVWELQAGQTLAESSEGIFCIKYLSIVHSDMGLFYAFKSAQQGEPDVTAVSLLDMGAEGSIQTPLTTRVEVLGSLGEGTVGIVHIQWIDRPGQKIILTITPAGKKTPVWQLTPLKQQYMPNEARSLYVSMYTDFHGLPDVEFYGPVKKQQIAFFRLHASGKPVPDIAPIFIRIPRTHSAVIAVLLTQNEYLALAGPMVNPITLHTESRFPSNEAQPTSIRNRRDDIFIEPPRLPAPDFEQLAGIEWPYGRGGGGRGADMFYWQGVLRTDEGIAEVASHYSSQLTGAGWVRTEEHALDACIWQAWTLKKMDEYEEEDERWTGLFLLLQNPGVAGQYIFYAQADRLDKPEVF